MEGQNLIPGFRFYPTEEELISVYLHNKLDGNLQDFINQFMDKIIPVVDIYDYNPWDLPKLSGELCHGDKEQSFFFIRIQESQVQGGRPNRLTTTGYWKATGSPNYVYSCNSNRAIGVKRTMVFYLGRAPNGKKTEWKMNEYKAIRAGDSSAASSSSSTINVPNATTPRLRQEFSVCRVYKKSRCIRSFDRRPTKSSTSNVHHEMTNISSNDLPTILTPQHHMNPPDPVLMVEMRSSGNVQEISSSFGDQAQPSQIIGGNSTSGNIPLFIDNDQALWDWDDLINWF